MTISAPLNVKHAVHVEFDSKTGTYTGLPADWAAGSGTAAGALHVHVACTRAPR